MDAASEQHNPYGASLIMRHYSQIMPMHFDISPNLFYRNVELLLNQAIVFPQLYPPLRFIPDDACFLSRSDEGYIEPDYSNTKCAKVSSKKMPLKVKGSL